MSTAQNVTIKIIKRDIKTKENLLNHGSLSYKGRQIQRAALAAARDALIWAESAGSK